MANPLAEGIRAVGFDWNGVFLDDSFAVYLANQHMLVVRGKEAMDFEEWKRRSQPSVRELMLNHGVVEDSEGLYKEYVGLYNVYVKLHPLKEIPGAMDAARHLKEMGYVNAVISTHPEKLLKECIGSYGLSSCIDLVYAEVKSKAESISRLSEKLGIPASQVLYGGDTVFDVDAARQAGAQSFAVTTGYHSRDRLIASKPTLGVLENLGELVGMLWNRRA